MYCDVLFLHFSNDSASNFASRWFFFIFPFFNHHSIQQSSASVDINVVLILINIQPWFNPLFFTYNLQKHKLIHHLFDIQAFYSRIIFYQHLLRVVLVLVRRLCRLLANERRVIPRRTELDLQTVAHLLGVEYLPGGAHEEHLLIGSLQWRCFVRYYVHLGTAGAALIACTPNYWGELLARYD